MDSKHWALNIGFGLCALAVSAQSTQQGVVLEYHGEATKTPMNGVAITALNAASTVSGSKGEFTLQFRTLKAGDNITFKRIQKVGYEVMNKEAVEVMRVARGSNEAPLCIILCKSDELNKLRDGYRTVAAQQCEKRLKVSTAEVERLREEGKMREEEYNSKLDSLEQAFESQLQNMETYIDRFARIDLSELDETEKEIIALVQEGKIDEAIQKYDDLRLTEKLQQNVDEQKDLRKAYQAVSEAEKRKQEEAEAIEGSMKRQKEILDQQNNK